MKVGFGVKLGHTTLLLRARLRVPGSMFVCWVRVLGSMFEVRRSRFGRSYREPGNPERRTPHPEPEPAHEHGTWNPEPGTAVYSIRNAITGSTRVARHAGPATAIAAVASRISVVAAKVIGSSGATPNRNAES